MRWYWSLILLTACGGHNAPGIDYDELPPEAGAPAPVDAGRKTLGHPDAGKNDAGVCTKLNCDEVEAYFAGSAHICGFTDDGCGGYQNCSRGCAYGSCAERETHTDFCGCQRRADLDQNCDDGGAAVTCFEGSMPTVGNNCVHAVSRDDPFFCCPP